MPKRMPSTVSTKPKTSSGSRVRDSRDENTPVPVRAKGFRTIKVRFPSVCPAEIGRPNLVIVFDASGKEVEMEVQPPGTHKRIAQLEELVRSLWANQGKAPAGPAPLPTWDPYVEGRRILDELKQAEGGAFNRTQAAKWLDISASALHQRRDRREVVAWTDAAGRFRFPRWQFIPEGMLPGVAECLREMKGADPWAVMRFFLTPSESAGGKRPLDLLRDGNVAAALELARAQPING